MKRSLILLSLILSLNACAATSITTPTTPSSPIVSAQDAAGKNLYAIGAALQATPGILESLYSAGKLSKADYNKVVPTYNQALGSFNLAVNALQVAVKAGQDPGNTTAYLEALNAFLLDKATLDNLLLAFGQKPIGAGTSHNTQ